MSNSARFCDARKKKVCAMSDASSSAPAAPEPPAPNVDPTALQEIASGVYVITDQRVPLVPNIGIILGSGAALVVDTGMGPVNGQKVLDCAKKLAGERFILFNRLGAPSAFDQIIATCRGAGFSPHIILEPSSLAAVITLVESGLGVSLVPGCARSLPQKTVAFRPLATRSKPISLCVVWPRATDNPAVEAFLEILRSQELAIKKQMAVQ